MSESITINFKNGMTRVVDPTLYSTSEPFGTSALSELTLRSDDLSRGLFVEVAHHAPPHEGESTSDPEGRLHGVPWMYEHDCYFQIISPEEMDGASEVRFGSRIVLGRVLGSWVNYARLSATLTELFGSTALLEQKGALATIGDVLEYQMGMRERESAFDDELDGRAASDEVALATFAEAAGVDEQLARSIMAILATKEDPSGEDDDDASEDDAGLFDDEDDMAF